MYKKLLFLLIAVSSLCPLHSQQRMRLAIIDFTAKGVSRADAEMVNDLLRSKMINTGEFIVLERSQMKEIMREQSFQMTGCTDTECAVKVGRLLSARKMLVGTITQWRRKILITGRIIDVEKGIADFAHDETIEDIEDLDKGISFFALNLTRRIKGQDVISMEKRGEHAPAGKDNIPKLQRPPSKRLSKGERFVPSSGWVWICTGDLDVVTISGKRVALYDSSEKTGLIVVSALDNKATLIAPWGGYCEPFNQDERSSGIESKISIVLSNGCGNSCSSVNIKELDKNGNIISDYWKP